MFENQINDNMAVAGEVVQNRMLTDEEKFLMCKRYVLTVIAFLLLLVLAIMIILA